LLDEANTLAVRAASLETAGGALFYAIGGIKDTPPAQGTSSRFVLTQNVINLGNDLPEDFAADIQRIELLVDRPVFSESPEKVPIDQMSTDSRGVVGALANARAWSLADLGDARRAETDVESELNTSEPNTGLAVDRMVKFHQGVYSLWRMDRAQVGTQGAGPSPLLLALAMNVRVQERWQALSGDVYASLAASHQGVHAATAQVIASMRAGEFAAVSTQWRQFIDEYRRLADAEGGTAAQRALDEVEAALTKIGRATEEALLDAKLALERSGEARTLGQRVLFESIGDAQFQRAATIARLSQEAVTGTWSQGELSKPGILQNALGITEAYGRVVDHAIRSGLELPLEIRVLGGANSGGVGDEPAVGTGGGNS
jgi:hypothetical protein